MGGQDHAGDLPFRAGGQAGGVLGFLCGQLVTRGLFAGLRGGACQERRLPLGLRRAERGFGALRIQALGLRLAPQSGGRLPRGLLVGFGGRLAVLCGGPVRGLGTGDRLGLRGGPVRLLLAGGGPLQGLR
ncbi:hypothetical protein [Streptomyces sp. NPDC008121]|uniref:hypothetical protein n=1 Tax=Streptomyces sp. NPDC008121 TaxID=3364809 RepID=UPI0036F17318